MRNFILALQHVLAMFGATVLVPLITGLNPAVALFTAGAGTLTFHLITGGQVPVFLGSSFAFIAGILAVDAIPGLSLAHATGAFLGVGVVYLLMAILVYFVGPDRVKKVFPPIVTGPIIIVIGLILAPVAIDMASNHWPVALITMAAIILVGIVSKGFFRFIPILSGVIIGYIAAAVFGLVDLTPVYETAWLRFPDFMAPKFSLEAFSIIVPIALVTMIEHIGDITTNGAVVGKNFFERPGLHRTLLGDGVATALAGLLGGPANTTYGENTGVLAVTKNYNPAILRYAAVIAIILSFIGKFGALIQTIPVAVMGGVSFILFGMIASIGVKTLIDSGPDLTNLRNSSVVFIILITGILGILDQGVLGLDKVQNPLAISITSQASLSGLSLAALLGVILNWVLGLIPDRVGEEAAAHNYSGSPAAAKKINEE